MCNKFVLTKKPLFRFLTTHLKVTRQTRYCSCTERSTQILPADHPQCPTRSAERCRTILEHPNVNRVAGQYLPVDPGYGARGGAVG
jgi:hypothetical protein